MPIRLVSRLAPLAAALACALVLGCAPGPERAIITIDEVTLDVVVARDEATQETGLVGYSSLGDGEGMAFVWDEPARRTFVMKDVSFPIDVVFVGLDGRVAEVFPLDPGDAESVTGSERSTLVLEVPRGWLEENGLGVGSAVDTMGLAEW